MSSFLRNLAKKIIPQRMRDGTIKWAEDEILCAQIEGLFSELRPDRVAFKHHVNCAISAVQVAKPGTREQALKIAVEAVANLKAQQPSMGVDGKQVDEFGRVIDHESELLIRKMMRQRVAIDTALSDLASGADGSGFLETVSEVTATEGEPTSG